MTAETIKKGTEDPRFARQFKHEMLKQSAKRMMVFCFAYALFQLIVLVLSSTVLSPLSTQYFVLYRFGTEIWQVGNVVAICLGVLLGVLSALVAYGRIKHPRTQNLVLRASFIILVIFQFFLCAVELSASGHLHNFVVFIFMLGLVPLLSRVQSSIVILGLTALCLIAATLLTHPSLHAYSPFIMDDSWSPFGLITMFAYNTGHIYIILAVIIASLAASWTSYALVKKSILAQIALEQKEREVEDLVEARTAELKEEVRVAEASNQAKTRFLTRVSHELRTAMTTISGMAFLAKETTDPQSRQENLEAIELASQRIKGVVDNIIDNTVIEMSAAEDDLEQELGLLNAETPAPLKKIEQVKAPDLTGRTLLIVEDLPTNRLVLKEFLKHTHATVEEAENGLEAVQMFAKSPEGYYSFIFMDLLMPEMSGHDATRAIRKMERADALNIPIVAVSANAFQADIEASLAAGMDAHLAKPIEQSAIFRILIERLHD